MTASELAILAQSLAPAVQHVVTKAMAPFHERLAAMEARQAAVKDLDFDLIARLAAGLVPVPKDGTNGKDADEAAVLALQSDLASLRDDMAAVKALPAPVVPDVAALVTEAMQEAVEGWRPTVGPIVAEHVREAVANLPPPERGVPGEKGDPGASVDPTDVEALIVKAVSELPTPKDGLDGQSVTVEDVAPLIAGEVEKAVKALPVPKDGVGVAGALINNEDVLCLTLSDGTVKELGNVAGRDVDMALVHRLIAEEVAKIPPPKNGLDGLGIDHLSFRQEHERQFIWRWEGGGRVIEEKVSVPYSIWRGIWNREKAYEVGDEATYGGGIWHCLKDAPAGMQPGTVPGAEFWQLAVKSGDQGKPGAPGKKGDPGPKGKDGVDPWGKS